jgi:hypothetical protein
MPYTKKILGRFTPSNPLQLNQLAKANEPAKSRPGLAAGPFAFSHVFSELLRALLDSLFHPETAVNQSVPMLTSLYWVQA